MNKFKSFITSKPVSVFSTFICGLAAATSIIALAMQAPLTTIFAVVYTGFFIVSFLLLEGEVK